MSEQAWLDVLGSQRFTQQGVVEQINLPYGEVIGCRPIRINLLKLHCV